MRGMLFGVVLLFGTVSACAVQKLPATPTAAADDSTESAPSSKSSGGGSGCSKDTDCKGERVCEDGKCVKPKSAKDAPAEDSAD